MVLQYTRVTRGFDFRWSVVAFEWYVEFFVANVVIVTGTVVVAVWFPFSVRTITEW